MGRLIALLAGLMLVYAGNSASSGVDNYIFLGHYATTAAANDACMATVSGSGFCQTDATPDHPVCGTGYTLYNFYYRFGVPPDKIIINEIYATACDPSGCPAIYPEQDSASGQCLAECPQGDTLCMARNLGAPSCNTGNLAVGNP
jgi:hypothetical protein